MQEVGDQRVEQARLLEIEGVAGVRQYHQSRAWDGTLHQERGFEARIVFVTRHHERGYGHSPHRGDQIKEGWAALLHAAQSERRAARGMLGEHPAKLLPSARVLVLQLHAGRPGRIAGYGFFEAETLETLRGRFRFILKLLAARWVGPVTASADNQ